MAGSPLFGLEDEADTGGFDGGFDAVGLVADDVVDVVDLAGGDESFGGGDDVEEESLSAKVVNPI